MTSTKQTEANRRNAQKSTGPRTPEGKAAVWRTRDGGDHWEALRKGLPQENAFFCVLR